MIDFGAILAGLKLAEFAYTKAKDTLTKRQKAKIVQQAERLVRIANEDELRQFDTEDRRRVLTFKTSAVAKRAPRAGGFARKKRAVTVAVRKKGIKKSAPLKKR
jgi:hypothetical protein